MSTLVLAYLLLLAIIVPSAATAQATALLVPVVVPNSRQVDFQSTVTGRPYRLLIAVPSSAPPAKGFPVIYVLDGNLYFATVVDSMRLQGRHFLQEAVVVGIGYQTDDMTALLTLRDKDLTLPIDAAGVAALGASVPPGVTPASYGGLDAFLRMIDEEVKPRIAALTTVDRDNQILFGHSLGGLTTLRALFTRPAQFRGYIASAPSIWWNNRAVLADQKALRAWPSGATPRRVMLDVGELEDQLPPLSAAMKSRVAELQKLTEAARMVGNVRDLGAELAKVPGARTTTVVFAGEDHVSVVPGAIARGLRIMLAHADGVR